MRQGRAVKQWAACPYLWLSAAATLTIAPGFVDAYGAPKFFALYVVLIGTLFIFPAPTVRPQLLSGPVISYLGMWAWVVASAFANSRSFYRFAMVEWLCFGALSYTAYARVRRNSADLLYFVTAIRFVTGVALILSLGDFLGWQPFTQVAEHPRGTLPFGNPNMLSLFLSLSLAAQLITLTVGHRGQLGLAMLSSAALAALGSRSSMLAVMALGPALVFLPMAASARRLRLGVWVAAIMLMLTTTVFSSGLIDVASANPRSLVKRKSESVRIRRLRLMNTAAMVKEAPWFGVGLGNFEFRYARYARRFGNDPEVHEFRVVRSPHNAYLELAAEAGVPALLGLVAFLILAGRALARVVRKRPLDSGAPIVLTMGTALGVEAWFGFPLEIAIGMLIAAVLTGAALALVGPAQELSRNFRVAQKFFFLAAALIGALAVGLGHWQLSALRPDLRWAQAVLKLDPAFWRLRVHLANAAVQNGNSESAWRILDPGLRAEPANYLLRKAAILVAARSGDDRRACEEYKKFEQTIGKNNSLRKEVTRLCAQAPRRVYRPSW